MIHTSLIISGKYIGGKLIMLRREIPMAWGTTTDILTPKINPFLYARETKHLTLKDLDSYLIPDG